MIVAVEDQIRLKIIDEERSAVDKEIDTQVERRERLQCQVQLLKLQLKTSMEQTERKI